MPEIRLAVGHPDLDLGNIETALDALMDKCYYLTVEKKNYKFSLKENLNKRFADKSANIKPAQIEETLKQEIQKQFAPKENVERVFFPEKSIQISDRPVVTLAIGDVDTRWKTQSRHVVERINLPRNAAHLRARSRAP